MLSKKQWLLLFFIAGVLLVTFHAYYYYLFVADDSFISFRYVDRLLEGKGLTDDEPGESYWKIANGIRLTGMPGFRPALSETQIWQVGLLVANADKLPKFIHDSLSAPLVSDEAAKDVLTQ